eukprot:4938866-Amphidinium_carterae.1
MPTESRPEMKTRISSDIGATLLWDCRIVKCRTYRLRSRGTTSSTSTRTKKVQLSCELPSAAESLASLCAFVTCLRDLAKKRFSVSYKCTIFFTR